MADDKKAAKAGGADKKAAKAGGDDKKPAKEARPAKEAKPAAAAKVSKSGKRDATGKASERGAVEAARPKGAMGKPRMAKHYDESVRAEMMKKFNYANPMQVPRIEKIVVNMGVGDAIQDQKLLDAAVNELGQITGQRPSLRRAKKSISNFKLREGQAIGCAVTLRGARMYEFYDRLVSVAVPRIRDFRGVSPRSFDGRGNYNMGLTEQIIFPEINYDKVGKVRGMDVTIVTTARDDEQGRELLRLMQMPFRQR
jgi:large subunit ribosomal protein L5